MLFFRVYEVAAPTLLLPLSYFLWLQWYDHDHRMVALNLSMPVLWAYCIPAVGTNKLRLWEFRTRWRLGRFRLQHGFVFGAATSLIAVLCLPPPMGEALWLELVRAGFVMGAVVGFCNWLYDIYAIRSGFIIVYNKPCAEGRGPEAIATNYAPVLFGVFGCCYGVLIRWTFYVLVEQGRHELYWPAFLGCNSVVLTLPVLAFVLHSYATSGTSGLKPYKGGH